LQCADYTIIFSDKYKNHLWNLKGILIYYEQISGMRINFHKSKIIPLNVDEVVAHELCHICLSSR
jgi:hypothetical protein